MGNINIKGNTMWLLVTDMYMSARVLGVNINNIFKLIFLRKYF